MGDLSKFFCKSKKNTCLLKENFVVAILYLVYFEDLWLKSCEFLKMMATYSVRPSFSEICEHGGNIVC